MLKRMLLILFMVLPVMLWAQTGKHLSENDTADLSELSLDQLLKLKSKYKATEIEKAIGQAIESASRNPMPMRRAPSIISIITKEDISRSGATTLADVLKMVPGLEYNVDVTGVVAISFRGLWANEGNLLLMIDGQECNETAYNSLQLGNHYPIDQLKRIEVIRGPGSAIYGGAAEYAVINIVTAKGSDLKGMEINATDGHTAEGFSKQNVNIAVGGSTRKASYSVSGFLGRAQTGTSRYTDVYGSGYTMKASNTTSTGYINANASYKGLSVRFIYDNYKINMRDGYIAALSKAYPCNFLNMMSEIRYQKNISKKLFISAKLNYKYNSPWENTITIADADTGNYSYYKITTQRFRAQANLNYNFTKWMNANVGFESIYDIGKKFNGEIFKYDSSDRVSYMNYAPFAQLFITTPIINLTVGGRYDISNAFGSAFNPRIGITKKVGMANFKALYASSFRAPSIEDIQYSIDKLRIRPERSNTLEFEASFKFGKERYLSANIFDITTYDAIKYYVKRDSVVNGDPDGYRNSNKVTGTQGFEIEYRSKPSFGTVNASYSYYTAQNKGIDSSNMVFMRKDILLGTAQHKFSVLITINLSKKFYISSSAQFLGSRYGINAVDTAGNPLLHKYPSQFFLGLGAGTTYFKNFLIRAGVNNITNQQTIYIQAYNSMHAPLPGPGREYYLSVKYCLPFKQLKGRTNE